MLKVHELLHDILDPQRRAKLYDDRFAKESIFTIGSCVYMYASERNQHKGTKKKKGLFANGKDLTTL